MTDRRLLELSTTISGPLPVVTKLPIVSTLKPTPAVTLTAIKPFKKVMKDVKLPKKKEIVVMPQFTAKTLKDEIKVIENELSDSLVCSDPIEPGSPGPESGPEIIPEVISIAPIGSTNGSTSGYGSEGYVSEEEKLKNLKNVETLKVLDIRDEHTHCARCHKTFDPLSASNAEKRCLLPHPTKMVIPIRRDTDGTHFVCLCCRTEFKLPKMTFYEAGVNSMLTGYCFIGQHTADQDDIDYQYDGGAALSCEEAGCIEFFV
jgi:hypothetical protein